MGRTTSRGGEVESFSSCLGCHTVCLYVCDTADTRTESRTVRFRQVDPALGGWYLVYLVYLGTGRRGNDGIRITKYRATELHTGG